MKIHEYNEMMAYLTRPAVYRRGFFKGEQVLSKAQVKKIKNLYLKGQGYPKIANQYGVGKTTIEGLINDMKAGKVPFETLTDTELKTRKVKQPGMPSKTADPEGLAKWVQEFDGTTRPNFTAVAKEFGYKDKSAVNTAIAKVGREDILDLPYLKGKETLRKEAVAKKNVNFLDDVEFEKLSRNFSPETYDNFVTGSDTEFAEYLNSKGHKAFGNKDFNTKSVLSRRKRLDLPQTNITSRGNVRFSDEFILQEANRMYLKYDLKKDGIEKIRNRVYTARDQEKNLTFEEKEKLYKQRQTPPKTPKQHPYNIGKKPSPEKLFWRDLLTNAQRHQSFLKGRAQGLPESHIKFLNPDQIKPTDIKSTFDIKLIDTNVIDPKTGKPKVLTYDNFLQHIDENQKLYRTDSKTALGEYKKKRFIQENTDLYKQFGKTFGQLHPFHIHHTAGRGANAFNVQFAVGSENMQENALRRTFDREWKAAKNFGEQRAAVKKYLDKVPKNLEVRLKNTPYGVRETFVDMTGRIAPDLKETVIQRGGVQLKANVIPGLENLIKSVQAMPDDFRAKRYWTLGLKGLGILATPIIAYDGYTAIRDGLPPDEVAARALLGADKLLYKGKEVLQLTPEEKEARSVVKQNKLRELNEDQMMGFGFIEGPEVDSDLSVEEAEAKWKEGQDRYADFRKEKDAARAFERAGIAKSIKDRIYGVPLEEITDQVYNQGGRVGFDEGSKPKSPSRRAFIKGITALAALPIVGKYFKLGKVLQSAKPYLGPTVEKIKGMPEWFPSLVKKLWNEGEDVTKQMAYGERQIVKRGTLEGGDDVDMIYEMDTGNVSINVTPKKGTYETKSGAYNKEYSLDYTKGEVIDDVDVPQTGTIDPKTGYTKKVPDDFSVAEIEGRMDQQAMDIDWEGKMTTVDEAMSDLTELEAFAKNKTTKQIYKKKGTKPKDVFPDYDPGDYDID